MAKTSLRFSANLSLFKSDATLIALFKVNLKRLSLSSKYSNRDEVFSKQFALHHETYLSLITLI